LITGHCSLITDMTVHKSVLLKETIEALNLKEGMIVVDATLGGGGHAREILKKIGDDGKLIAFDWDKEAIERFEGVDLRKRNAVLVNESFGNIDEVLNSLQINKVDAIVADLGISSDQLDDARRGLSFQKDAPLDMRLDRSKSLTAAEVVNSYSEEDLKKIIREYGDERFAARIASAIAKARNEAPIKDTKQLAKLIVDAVPEMYRRGRIHPATKTFQALRIEVNGELDAIKAFIPEAIEKLAPKGRLAIISFHSGEDSIVKNMLREYARGCICPPEMPVCVCGIKPKVKLITRKPMVSSEEEIARNPRSRSAKLRVAEKL